MLNRKALKVLLRSGSYAFMHDSSTVSPGSAIRRYWWRGTPIGYRPGTTDTTVIYEALLKSGHKSEYRVPSNLDPKVILDIGGHIGVASIFFAHTFPAAKIYSFEPVPENFALLKQNVASLPNVSAIEIALGAEDRESPIFGDRQRDNLGGFSLYDKHTDASRAIVIQVRNTARCIASLGIDRVDLIKIDTEGAEYEILTAFDPGMLAEVRWIVGELHGIRDFETLTYLSRWFDIDVRRSLGKPFFMFHACNRNFVEKAIASGWRQRR
jgi:FkbM family methyltransferase